MIIEILGPAHMVGRDGPSPLPSGHPGRLLQMLILRPGQAADQYALSRELWPDAAPGVALARLRVTATRLRASLAEPVELAHRNGRYELNSPGGSLDLVEFLALAERAEAGDRDAARRALGLWRGEPFTGFTASGDVRRRRGHLHSVKRRLESIANDEHPDSTPPGEPAPAPAGASVIGRPRLLGRLPPAGTVRLIALTAPAGFGKSMLLDQWAARETDVARISIGRTAEAGLCSHLAAGLAGVLPHGRTAGWETSLRAEWDVTVVVNALLDVDGPVGVVIDDLHLGSTAVRSEMRALVDRAPPTVTFAIASRQTLPFSISRLRATGDAIQVTAADLAFTPEESAGAVAAGGIVLSERRAGRLRQVTGGWPRRTLAVAGQLATVPDQQLAGWEPVPDDALSDDVLAGLSEPERTVVGVVARLGRVDPTAATAALAIPDAAATLQRLCRHHLLLDEDADGYRPIPGVGGLLGSLRPPPPAGATDLQLSLASWYQDRGSPKTALRHAVEAGDDETVRAYVDPAVERALRRGDATYLQRWLPKIDPSLFEPGVSMDRAVLCSSLLAPGERGPWDEPALRRRVHPAIDAIAEGVDLLRQGRCHRALAAVTRARRNIAAVPPDDPELGAAMNALVAVVETDCRILLGTPTDADLGTPWHLSEAPWAWLRTWSTGTRAVRAYVAGHTSLAWALLDQARPYDDLAPSWARLSNGASSICRALRAFEAATTNDERHAAAEHARHVVSGLDRTAHDPTAVLARLVLQPAMERAGTTGHAVALAADLDVRLSRHPDLALLHEARRAIAERADLAHPAQAVRSLTPAECVVLDHLSDGLTLEEIGEALYLSAHTVRRHARSIYQKLGVRNRAHAVAFLTRL